MRVIPALLLVALAAQTAAADRAAIRTLSAAPAKRVAVSLRSIYGARPDVPKELRAGLQALGLIERKSAADFATLKEKAGRIQAIDDRLVEVNREKGALSTRIGQLEKATATPVKERSWRKGLQQREQAAHDANVTELATARGQLETLTGEETRMTSELSDAFKADSEQRRFRQVGDEYLATTQKGSTFAEELEVVTHQTSDLTLSQANRLYKKLVRSGELEDKRRSLSRERAAEHPHVVTPVSRSSTRREPLFRSSLTSGGLGDRETTRREPTFLDDMITTDPSRFHTPGGMLNPNNPASPLSPWND
jgi:hypothetical protein